MANEIRVPRLGWSMEEGTFVGWLKGDGDAVQVGEALFELEGEKALQEVESLDVGILRISPNAPAAGSVVPVGTLLGYVLAVGEMVPVAGARTEAATSSSRTVEHSMMPQVAPLAPRDSGPTECHSMVRSTLDGSIAAPSVRRLARELGVDLCDLNGSGVGGRIDAGDVRRGSVRPPAQLENSSVPSIAHGRRTSSPRARRVARELGVDWTQVTGSGCNGRVRERDVRSFLVAQPSRGHGTQAASVETRMNAGVPALTGGLIPISQRRRVIAERMQASLQQSAPVTLTAQADVTALVKLRRQLQGEQVAAGAPSYSDIIALLTARTLLAHRVLAGRWTARGIELPADDELHIGMAVDTDAGLLVPVVRDVARRSLSDVAADAKRLVAAARAGRLPVSEMQGGVFTITNLGSFGIDAFTPIINLPEVAILGLGAIRREAVVLDDNSIGTQDVMTLSLTFDHRVLDGAPAARFLQDLMHSIATVTNDLAVSH